MEVWTQKNLQRLQLTLLPLQTIRLTRNLLLKELRSITQIDLPSPENKRANN